ncbi:MAG: AraC family transcriptional regulator [Planctomycetota bacterium]
MHKSHISSPKGRFDSGVPFPEGIPFYAGRHGHYIWPEGAGPVLLLHDDFDVLGVTRGRAAFELPAGTFRAGPGDFLVLPPFVPGWIREMKGPLEFGYCHFAFRPVPREIPPFRRGDAAGPGGKALLPFRFSGREAPAVRAAFRRLGHVAVTAGNAPGTPWRLEAALLAFAQALADFGRRRSVGGRVQAPAPADRRVAALCRRVEAEPARMWTVRDLAKLAGFSAGHLHAVFSRALGKSPKEYLVEARLRRAMTLLRPAVGERFPSVKEVAAACGYSTQHFFSRQFKQYLGVSPLGYRRGATFIAG